MAFKLSPVQYSVVSVQWLWLICREVVGRQDGDQIEGRVESATAARVAWRVCWVKFLRHPIQSRLAQNLASLLDEVIDACLTTITLLALRQLCACSRAGPSPSEVLAGLEPYPSRADDSAKIYRGGQRCSEVSCTGKDYVHF